MMETPLPTPPARKRIKPPQPQPLIDLDPQLYRLLNSSHHILNSTNPTLTEDFWLCLSLILPQILANPMSSLEAFPGHKLNPLLTRVNVTNIKLILSVHQCLQSLQGSIPLGEVSKSVCINQIVNK
jgi:hypothetical protein